MHTTSIFDAKTHLSRIIADLADGKDDEVQILKRGKPVATLSAVKTADTSQRIGVARGKFIVPDNIDTCNPEIARLFAGEN